MTKWCTIVVLGVNCAAVIAAGWYGRKYFNRKNASMKVTEEKKEPNDSASNKQELLKTVTREIKQENVSVPERQELVNNVIGSIMDRNVLADLTSALNHQKLMTDIVKGVRLRKVATQNEELSENMTQEENNDVNNQKKQQFINNAVGLKIQNNMSAGDHQNLMKDIVKGVRLRKVATQNEELSENITQEKNNDVINPKKQLINNAVGLKIQNNMSAGDHQNLMNDIAKGVHLKKVVSQAPKKPEVSYDLAQILSRQIGFESSSSSDDNNDSDEGGSEWDD